MRVALLAALLAIGCAIGCASGTNAGPPAIDAETAKDAAAIDSKSIDPDPIDAPPIPIDAPAVLPDAPPPDAPPSGGACSRNDQCPHPDECCVRFNQPIGICAEGYEVDDECVPKL